MSPAVVYVVSVYGAFLLLLVVVSVGIVIEQSRPRHAGRPASVCEHEDDGWTCVREIPRGLRYKVELAPGCGVATVTCTRCEHVWHGVPVFGERRATS